MVTRGTRSERAINREGRTIATVDVGSAGWLQYRLLNFPPSDPAELEMVHPRLRLVLPGFVVACVVAKLVASAEPIDFTRDIRPILSNHCWSCHGPDQSTRKGGLRLDLRDTAFKPGESGALAISPGKPDESELLHRIDSTDETTLMPPTTAKKPLSVEQKQKLHRWIAEGAPFAEHWSFRPAQRPPVPEITDDSWSSNPIDRFVIQRLRAENLRPSEPTDRSTWLRRVALDLTGLPPTLESLDEFLRDASGNAKEKAVNRLLDSPAFAERMAMHWLDAARYADTNGYNNDEMRTMWPWRDWVINAFATNMPYDQFIVEQLAGDLLPNATVSQRVATGFNRNHVLTTEGGVIEEEYHVEYVADRVHTTATVFLAMSMQCARCHEHKYDPISQREYYQFASYFNNIPDKIVGYSKGRMAEPLLKVPSREQTLAIEQLAHRQKELEDAMAVRAANVGEPLAKWEQTLSREMIDGATPIGLVAHFAFDETEGESTRDFITPARQAKIVGNAKRSTGKSLGALEFDGATYVDGGDAGAFDSSEKFSLTAWIQPTSKEPTTVLSKMDEDDAYRGYDIIMEDAKVACHMSHHWPDNAFKVVTKEPVSLNEWHHVVVTYNGNGASDGLKVYVDGKLRSVDVTTNNKLTGTLKTDKPFHIGRRSKSVPFKGKIDEVLLFAAELSEEDAGRLASGKSLFGIAHILQTPIGDRTPEQKKWLDQYYLEQVDNDYRQLKAERDALPKKIEEIDKAIPVTMVMQEQEPRRATFLLHRGQYDQRGEEVSSGVPVAFGKLPEGVPNNRLGLAQWLTNRSHPLTARVAVNRWWEMFFGIGLVETTEDFGAQGATPSHPELLDWLAVEFMDSGWNVRSLFKTIVLSSTYGQSSKATPTQLERDPRNRLLGRGPRYRLPAETVRDNALAVSGLLKPLVGGPSVRPYQPEGLWEDVSVERREKYVPEVGDGLYRRSMYTFWKRTCPPPTMSTFDAPDRETCVVRRARTNTPLQALVLLNDPTYVEAARKLAERVLVESDENARITRAFRIVVSRPPRDAERKIVVETLRLARERFQHHRDDAEKLLSVGASPRNAESDLIELAAWTTISSMLLNMDEAISKS